MREKEDVWSVILDCSYSDMIKNAEKIVIGEKQTLDGIERDKVALVVVAIDCDDDFKARIFHAAAKGNVKIVQHFTRMQLGKLVNVEVKTGVVSVYK